MVAEIHSSCSRFKERLEGNTDPEGVSPMERMCLRPEFEGAVIRGA